jgi:hypothetical protein
VSASGCLHCPLGLESRAPALGFSGRYNHGQVPYVSAPVRNLRPQVRSRSVERIQWQCIQSGIEARVVNFIWTMFPLILIISPSFHIGTYGSGTIDLSFSYVLYLPRQNVQSRKSEHCQGPVHLLSGHVIERVQVRHDAQEYPFGVSAHLP